MGTANHQTAFTKLQTLESERTQGHFDDVMVSFKTNLGSVFMNRARSVGHYRGNL